MGIAFRIIAGLFRDGYRVLGVCSWLLSAAFTIAKIFDAVNVLRQIDYAWALLPLTIWLFVAYVRRWLAYEKLENQKRQAAIEKARRRCINKLLASTVDDGNTLLGQVASADPESFEADTSQWATRARDIVKSAFGDGEAILLLSSSGYVFHSDMGQPNERCRIFIDGRLRRLGELISRANSLPLEDEFDPKEWESS